MPTGITRRQKTWLILFADVGKRNFTITGDRILDEKSVIITRYASSKQKVVIPPKIQGLPVTYIGARAFSEKYFISSVTIPDSVTVIGRWAFLECDSLTSVTFQGTIDSGKFGSGDTLPGDLQEKYLAGGIGTYTRSSGGDVWTKQ